MTATMLPLAAVLCVAVAIRSTWSPCGVSMLSTLTPLSERGRGHRWPATAAWYTAGGTVGGLLLGLLVAPAAWVAAALPLADGVRLLLAGAAALAALATDLRITRHRLPGHTRQVDEVWLTRYRPWVYAGGFGVQIGFGFATVFMTGALYLMVVVMGLTGSPAAAILLGGLFGLGRGAMIWTGFRLDRPSQLQAFHRRFAEIAPLSIALVVAAEAATLLVTGWAARVPAAGVAATLVPLAVFAAQQRRRARRREPLPLTLPIAVARVPG